VLCGQVKPLYVLEKNLVVFRTTSGKIHVLDAFCPHLGANIGVGGSVVGEDIRCPFHSWTFNGDGICTSVPGLECKTINFINVCSRYSSVKFK
jgi:phenylpropionate dioxygenase-like ring-hydroxylating dioxygenase large terminal subunit